ncbi:MAG: hypothetical protein CMJ58_01590 [Planctomycetaceae bacterium]|nr:hypothetical protein [Planctomycetaceae bacterium]
MLAVVTIVAVGLGYLADYARWRSAVARQHREFVSHLEEALRSPPPDAAFIQFARRMNLPDAIKQDAAAEAGFLAAVDDEGSLDGLEILDATCHLPPKWPNVGQQDWLQRAQPLMRRLGKAIQLPLQRRTAIHSVDSFVFQYQSVTVVLFARDIPGAVSRPDGADRSPAFQSVVINEPASTPAAAKKAANAGRGMRLPFRLRSHSREGTRTTD